VRVLSVNHGPSVGGGIFDRLVEENGHELERWLVPSGPHEEPPEAYGAIMVFGGGMHPDEDTRHPWLAGEAEFLQQTLAGEVPLLGVCLGAQLIARAAGAWVGPADVPEVGWLPVELTPAGRADPVLGVLPSPFDAFQWHFYTYAVPSGGVELAVSPACTQAFRLGRRAWGIQFHAEVTRSMIETWVDEEVAELPLPAEELLAATTGRIARWNAAGRDLCQAFLGMAAARPR
jgi:GMP synthase-like glutamine amidotransferase